MAAASRRLSSAAAEKSACENLDQPPTPDPEVCRLSSWGRTGTPFGNWRSKPWPAGMEEFVIDSECKIGPGMVVFSRPTGVPGKGRPPLGASLGVRHHTLLVKVDPFLFTLP